MDFGVVKNGLIPLDDSARVKMAELSVGEKVRVRIQQAPAFRDFVHMVLARIGRARGIQNPGGWLAIATGRFDLVPQPDGSRSTLPVPHSLSAMSAVEFEAYWEDAREVILAQVLPMLLDQVAAAEVRAMIEERRK